MLYKVSAVLLVLFLTGTLFSNVRIASEANAKVRDLEKQLANLRVLHKELLWNLEEHVAVNIKLLKDLDKCSRR